MKIFILTLCVSFALAKPVEDQPLSEATDAQEFANLLLLDVESDASSNESILKYGTATAQDLDDNISALIASSNSLLTEATQRCESGDLKFVTTTKAFTYVYDLWSGVAEDSFNYDLDYHVKSVQKPSKKVTLAQSILKKNEINKDVSEDADYIITKWDGPSSSSKKDCKGFLKTIAADLISAEQSIRNAQALSKAEGEYLGPLNDAVANRSQIVQYFTDLSTNKDTTKAIILVQLVKIASGIETD